MLPHRGGLDPRRSDEAQSDLVIGVLAVALSAVVAVAVPSAQAKTGGSYTVPYNDTTTTGAPATGSITITRFEKVGGVINAVGTFTGTIEGVNGGQQVTSGFTAPVTQADGKSLTGGASSAAAAAGTTCQILTLTLGPLHLNLLGLVVDLNQVNLNITAQQGSGTSSETFSARLPVCSTTRAAGLAG